MSEHKIVWSATYLFWFAIFYWTFFIFNKYISYFEKKLQTEIILNSNVISFNLSNHYFEEYISGSLVLIEDAAHSIHPLAGQGINLGFADADAFCEEIINAYESKINFDKKLALKKYEIRRKSMNLIMLKSMNFFVNWFGWSNIKRDYDSFFISFQRIRNPKKAGR